MKDRFEDFANEVSFEAFCDDCAFEAFAEGGDVGGWLTPTADPVGYVAPPKADMWGNTATDAGLEGFKHAWGRVKDAGTVQDPSTNKLVAGVERFNDYFKDLGLGALEAAEAVYLLGTGTAVEALPFLSDSSKDRLSRDFAAAPDAFAGIVGTLPHTATKLTPEFKADVVGTTKAIAQGDKDFLHYGNVAETGSIGARVAEPKRFTVWDAGTGETYELPDALHIQEVADGLGIKRQALSKTGARGVNVSNGWNGLPEGSKIWQSGQPPTKLNVLKAKPLEFHEVNPDEIGFKEKLISDLDAKDKRRIENYTLRRRALNKETPFYEHQRPQAIQDANNEFLNQYRTPEAQEAAREMYYDYVDIPSRQLRQHLNDEFIELWNEGKIADKYEGSSNRSKEGFDYRQRGAYIEDHARAVKLIKDIERARTRPIRTQADIQADWKDLTAKEQAFKSKHGISPQRRLAQSWEQGDRDSFRTTVDSATWDAFQAERDAIDWSDPAYKGYNFDPRYGFTRKVIGEDGEELASNFVNNKLNKQFALAVADRAWPTISRRVGLQSPYSHLYKNGDDYKRALEFAKQRSSYSFGFGVKPESKGFQTELWHRDEDIEYLAGKYDYKIDYNASLMDRLGIKDDYAFRGNVPSSTKKAYSSPISSEARANQKARSDLRKVGFGADTDAKVASELQANEAALRERNAAEAANKRAANEKQAIYRAERDDVRAQEAIVRAVRDKLAATKSDEELKQLVIAEYGDLSEASLRRAGSTLYPHGQSASETRPYTFDDLADEAVKARGSDIKDAEFKEMMRAQREKNKRPFNAGGYVRLNDGGSVSNDDVEDIIEGAHVPDSIYTTLPSGSYIVNVASSEHPSFRKEMLEMGGKVIKDGFRPIPEGHPDGVLAMVAAGEMYFDPHKARKYGSYLAQVNDWGRTVKRNVGQ